MALNNNAVFTAARGYIYTGAVANDAPTPTEIDGFDPDTFAVAGWNSIGHTSREDLPEFGFEGGDVETRGTWQAEVLKEVITEALADHVTFKLHQFDEEGLSLYYGVTNASSTTGVFEVSNSAVGTTERALLIVVVDGSNKIAFYAPKASIRREDAIELAVDEFSALPLRATFLKEPGSPLFQWISLDTGVNPAP
jgi:hypothetical protein